LSGVDDSRPIPRAYPHGSGGSIVCGVFSTLDVVDVISLLLLPPLRVTR
jgi:hypothetical protein